MSNPDLGQLDDSPLVYVEKRVNTLIGRSGGERGPLAYLRDELMSVGLLALVEASGRWSPEYGVTLGGYAHQRVVGALLDELRRHDLATREERRARREGHEVAVARHVELASLDLIAGDGPDPFDELEGNRRRRALHAALERLRDVAQRRLSGDSLDDIRAAHGISVSLACRLVKEAERRLTCLVRGEDPPPAPSQRPGRAQRRRWLREVAARAAAITASAGAAS
mgnify:CR=1 FL=1